MLCILLTVGACACGRENPETQTISYASESEAVSALIQDSTVTDYGAYELLDGVFLTKLLPYSGAFAENGTDSMVRNVLAVELVNTSDRHYQRIRFELRLPSGVYTFSVSALLAKSTVLLPEMNGAVCSEDLTLDGVELLEQIPFDFTPSVQLDTFRVSYADSILNVENKTDKTQEDVIVYYKSVSGDVFLGGPAYRVKVGTIKPGQIVQVPAVHFKTDSSRVIFVTNSKGTAD